MPPLLEPPTVQVLVEVSTPPAPAPAAPPPPAPTLEQRVAGLEAYLGNGDPSVALKVGPKDKDGNATIPAGLTTPAVGIPGPGHNAWLMISAALVMVPAVFVCITSRSTRIRRVTGSAVTEMAKAMKEETALWARVVRERKIKVE